MLRVYSQVEDVEGDHYMMTSKEEEKKNKRKAYKQRPEVKERRKEEEKKYRRKRQISLLKIEVEKGKERFQELFERFLKEEKR